MPYHVVKDGDQFCVEKQDGSKRYGCHATRGEADAQMAAMYANEPAARGLHLRGALGQARTEMWGGKEHLVVPVVALQEAVIHAVNAPTPEYVPRTALEATIGKWEGHPLVVGHPVRDGKQVSAHDAAVLAQHGFGFIRASRMSGTRLGMEAMVDPERLTTLKQDQLLADLRAGKPIEVSVGAFVTTNNKTGKFAGRNYDGEWTHIEPDHLAFLPGGVGACSMEMGCGAHRAAERYLVTAEGFKVLGDLPGHDFHGNQFTQGGSAQFTGKSADSKFEGSAMVTIVNPHSNADKVTHTDAKGHQYEGASRHIPTATVSIDRSKRGLASLQFEAHHHTLKALERFMEQSIIDFNTLRCLRDVPQSVRDEMKASDFAGPNETFPIKTQADVDAAAHLVGKAGDPAAVKARIIEIAKRKGLSIPDAWKVKAAAALPDKAQVDCPTCDGTGKIRNGNMTCPDCKGKGTAVKGAQMNVKSLKARILALFDTPEQAASEEAAELVAYNAMRTLFDGVGDQWDSVSGLIDALIADETENPTQTPEQEAAEEEVEDARLDAIRMQCYSMMAALQSICNACSEQQMPDAPPVSDPRYMERFKATVLKTAIGKEISAKNMATIQAAHDASHDMHGQTVALGAQCDQLKAMASAPTKMQDCPTCEGTGQVTTDGKQQDCPTCGGDGQIRAAELKAACRCEEAGMDKKMRIAALLGHEPIKAWATEKTLETMDEKQLTALETQCEKQKADLKAAEDAKAAVEAKLKTAEAATIPAEELASLRALSAEKQQRDAAEKAELVTKLAAASKALTKEQLEAKTLDDLRTLAAFAKVEAPAADFSIKGTPRPRAASANEDFAPPDPYNLKALQATPEKKAAVN